jgi:DNA-binding response OmpR family regulator
MLTTAGFVCLLAYDTDTAMALLKAHDIRAAILDYDLGDETSLCIAEQAYGSHIPYAFVTGRSRGEIIGHAPGPLAILSKPVDYADVARQLGGDRPARRFRLPAGRNCRRECALACLPAGPVP